MTDLLSATAAISKSAPWNKGKIARANAARPEHVWSIRTELQVEGRMRDLALFNLAIDSKLRGCDVVALKAMTSCRAVTRPYSERPPEEDRTAAKVRTH